MPVVPACTVTIMDQRLVQCFVLLLVVLTGLSARLVAQTSTPKPYRRAELPDFLDAKPSDIFFQNAFAEALRGTRPTDLGLPPTPLATGGALSNAEDPDYSKGGYAWSKIISATTIEDEIKVIRQAIDQIVTTPQKYRDGGFQDGRIQFSILALLFAIVHDYDDDVRWKKDAGHARDRFARAGRNSKVGSLSAYKEADERKTDLNELVRGDGLAISGPAQPNAWDQVVERPPLMKRFKLAYVDRISAWTADADSFRKHAEEILHEAELVAAIATAIHQKGFDLADDKGYAGYCQQLQQAASSVAEAARRNDAAGARQAAGKMAQACDDCHGDYR